MDSFEPHEISHACENYQPKFDPLNNFRNLKKTDTDRRGCKKYWETCNAGKHQHLVLRHKQACEYLNLPKGVEHLDECVCVKNENDEDVKADIELPKNNEIKIPTLIITENNVSDDKSGEINKDSPGDKKSLSSFAASTTSASTKSKRDKKHTHYHKNF